MRSLLILSFIFLYACAHEKKSQDKEPSNPATVAGTQYTTVVFTKGKSELTADSKDNLKKLAMKAHKDKRAIEEIRILAWSDTEYPAESQMPIPKSQVILAGERAQSIRDYLESDLQEENDIDAFNMAKRPDLLSKMLRNDEYDVKKAFETTGTTASRLMVQFLILKLLKRSSSLISKAAQII